MPLGRNPTLPPSTGGGASDGAAIVVAAYNAPDTWKDWATASGGVICDYTNDEVDINSVLQMTDAYHVLISPGEFAIDAQVSDSGQSKYIRACYGHTFFEVNSVGTSDTIYNVAIALSGEGTILEGLSAYDNLASPAATDVCVKSFGSNQRITQCNFNYSTGIGLISTGSSTGGRLYDQLNLLFCGTSFAAEVPGWRLTNSFLDGSAYSLRVLNQGYSISGVEDITIIGNRIGVNSGGVGLHAAYNGFDRACVMGNHFEGGTGNSTLYGIQISNACRGVRIEGNSFFGGRNALYLEGTDHLILGNTIDDARQHGIYCLDLDEATIQGNRIEASSRQTDDTYSGIILDGDCDNNSVLNNHVRRAASGNQPKYGIRIDDSTCNTNFVTGNDLLNSSKSGGTGAAYSDAGTGTVTTAGNRT